jgi:rubrerythrin
LGLFVEENWLPSSEDIGKLLFCSSLLEKKTFEMYNELSKKFDHPTITQKLVRISKDSLKHCNLLQEISKELVRKSPSEKECKHSFGEIWKQIERIAMFLKSRKSVSGEDFFEIINLLGFVERHMGEEYSTLEKLKTLSYMIKEISENYGIDLNSRKDVFESIISDEKEHADILFEIYKLLKKEINRPDLHPEFKYQNPDAWLTPSHSQKTGHVI